MCMRAQLSLTLGTPWTIALQALLSTGFFRQDYWSGLPFPTPGFLSLPGIKPASPVSPVMAGGLFSTESSGKPKLTSSLPLTSHLDGHHLRTLKSQMWLGCCNQIVRNQILNECLNRWINGTNRNLYWILFHFSEKEGKEDEDNKEGMFISSVQFSSVAQSCPNLRPHESQHARPPCPSPTPGV